MAKNEPFTQSPSVQVLPPGLLGYLQLKNLGQNPRSLIDAYQPTIDLRDWLLQANYRTLDRTVLLPNNTVGINGTTVPIIVPDTEWWFVHEAYLQTATLIATDTAAAGIGFTLPAAAPTFLGMLAQIRGPLTGPNKRLFSSNVPIAGGGIFLPAGAQVGVLVEQCASATTIQFEIAMRYSVLPI